MNAKLLAAVAAVAAIILGAVLFLTQSGSSSGSAPETSAGAVGQADGGSVPPELSELQPAEGSQTSETRTEASVSGSPSGTSTGSSAAPSSPVLQVQIEWPASVLPTEDLVVYAFPRRVQGATLAREASSDLDSITTQRFTNELFADIESAEEAGGSLLDRAYASASVSALTPTAGDQSPWGAELALPPGSRRAFVLAFGGGLGTDEPIEARVDGGTLTIRPQQLGSLIVNAETEVEGIDLEGAFASLKIQVAGAAMMSMGSTEQGRFRADRGLDGGGSVEFAGAPVGKDLHLRLLHDTLAPFDVTIPSLKAGETRQIRARLEAGLSVSGRVVDADGNGLSGAVVSASLPGQVFGFDDAVFRESESGPGGVFELSGLPSSTVVVRAFQSGALQSERVRINPATSSEADGLVLSLQTGKSVSGKALFMGGEPAAGVSVRASFDVAHLAGPSALGMTRGASNDTTVDEEGNFKLSGLGTGPFKVEAKTDPESTGGVTYVARLDGVRPGRQDLELILSPATSVAGLCVDDQESPVAGEWITLYRLVAGSMGDVRLDRQRAKTDPEGAFRFEGVTPGSWALSMASDRFVTPEEQALEVAMSAVTEVRVNVMRTVTVTGTVIDPDGQPVSGSRVNQASDEPVWRQALTGKVGAEGTATAEDGSFELIGVAPGDVRVRAVSNDFAPATSDVLPAAPGELIADLTLRLSRGATIEGVCFDKQGRTAGGRLITIQSMSMQMMRTLSTDAGGTFKQTGLTPGRYQIISMDPGADISNDLDGAGITAMFESMNMAMISLEEGETEFIYLGAPPASPVKVSGTVTMSGEAQPGLMVAYLPAASGMYDKMKLATTDEEGKYELTLDDSGDYIINVTDMNNAAIGQQRTTEFNEAVPRAVESIERDLKLPGGTIAGRVLTSDGDPAVGARLTLTGAGGVRTDQMMGGSYAEIMTGPDGAFEVVALQAGTYRVLAGGSTPLNESSRASARVMSKDIALGKDARVEGVTLQLVAPGQVDVVVRGVSGEPVTGATVFLRDKEGRHTELISLTATNAAGKVTLRGVAPGEYTVAARGDRMASPESALFEVREGATAAMDLQLVPSGFIVATTKVRGDGPPPPATVQVLDSTGKDVTRRVGMSDFQAKYAEHPFSMTDRRVGPLAPGRYTVLATTSDGRKAKRRVSVDANDERTVSLLLK